MNDLPIGLPAGLQRQMGFQTAEAYSTQELEKMKPQEFESLLYHSSRDEKWLEEHPQEMSHLLNHTEKLLIAGTITPEQQKSLLSILLGNSLALKKFKAADQLISRFHLPAGLKRGLAEKIQNCEQLKSALKNPQDCKDILEACAQDETWLRLHPIEAVEVFDQSLEFIAAPKLERSEKLALIETLVRHKLRLKKVDSLKNDTPFVFNDTHSRLLSSHSLAKLSELGKQILKNRYTPDPKDPIKINNERPVTEMLLSGISEFALNPPPETTWEDLKALLDYIKSDPAYPLISTLVEEELMKRVNGETAYSLYHLACEHKLLALQEATGQFFKKNLDDEGFYTLTSELGQVPENTVRTLEKSAMNYALDQLPEKFALLGEWPLKKEVSALTQEQMAAYQFIQALGPHLTKLKTFESDCLHKLPPAAQEWVLSKLPPSLETLNITKLTFKNLAPIQRFSALKELVCSSCPELSDLSALNKFPHLEALDLSKCPKLKNLMPIKNPRLKNLFFYECPLITEQNVQGVLQNLNKASQLDGLRILCDKKWSQSLINVSMSNLPFRGHSMQSENQLLEFIFPSIS